MRITTIIAFALLGIAVQVVHAGLTSGLLFLDDSKSMNSTTVSWLTSSPTPADQTGSLNLPTYAPTTLFPPIVFPPKSTTYSPPVDTDTSLVSTHLEPVDTDYPLVETNTPKLARPVPVDGNEKNHTETRRPTTMTPEMGPIVRNPLRYYSLVHGCIMYVAISYILTPGIFVSLYFKDLWQSKKIFGNAIWYQIHRILSYLFLVAVLLGCIALVLLHNGHFKAWMKGRDDIVTNMEEKLWVAKLHGVFGFGGAVVCLFVISMATFACKKEDPGHKIYVLLHSCIGALATLLCHLGIVCALIFFVHIFENMILSRAIGIVHILTVVLSFGAFCATKSLQTSKQACNSDDNVNEDVNEENFVPDVVFHRMRNIILCGYFVQVTINLIFIVAMFVYSLANDFYY